LGAAPEDERALRPAPHREEELPYAARGPTPPADEEENGENGEDEAAPEDEEDATDGADPDATATDSAEPAAPGKDGAVKQVPVRVYNNSNVERLAAQAAEDLRSRGWNVAASGNYSEGRLYHSTVYFRPGTAEEPAARAIGEEFGMRVAPRFEGIADASGGVIVIVTKDYQGAGGGKTPS
jgi:hypothetical protein